MSFLSNGKKTGNLYAQMEKYIKNVPFMFAVIVSAISAYLFFITNYSISIDDLSVERYALGGYLAAQGRFTSTIINCVLDFFNIYTGFSEFLGIFFLVISSIIFCVLFDLCYETKNKLPQTLFSCFFITSPIYVEIFAYSGCALAIGLGFTIVTLSLWCVFKAVEQNVKTKKSAGWFVLSTLLLIIVASWYESVLFVYYAAVFALITLNLLSEKQTENFSFKKIIIFGITFAIPLILAVVIEFVAQNIVSSIADIDVLARRTNAIAVSNLFSIGAIKAIIASSFYRYLLPALWYLPITLFVGALFVGAILFLFWAISRKNIRFLFAFIGLASSTVIITILTATPAYYRTNQPISFFIAFIVFMLLVSVANRGVILRRIILAVLVVICINQITEINHWFSIEEMRYQNEKQAVENIAFELNNSYDLSKPVVFVGEYKIGGDFEKCVKIHKDSFGYSVLKFVGEKIVPWDLEDEDKMLRIPQTICNSYITWGVDAFGEINTELLKFFSYLGYDLKQGTKEMYEDAKEKAVDMAEWPKNGSIVDQGEYILVNFGI